MTPPSNPSSQIRHFHHKPTHVEAVRFDNSFVFDDVEHLAGGDSSNVPGGLVVATKRGAVTVPYGQWLVKEIVDGTAVFQVLEDSAFRAQYEEVSARPQPRPQTRPTTPDDLLRNTPRPSHDPDDEFHPVLPPYA